MRSTELWWHLLNDHGIGPHYLHGNPYNIHAALVAGGACDGWEPTNVDKPKWADLFGIDPGFTDGKPTDEWLDEQRGKA